MRTFGTRVAAARLRGERVLLKAPARVRWPAAAAAPGAVIAVEGRLAALGPHDEHERRRGTHAILRPESIRATGARRGGLLGALDGVRARTERALTGGVPAPQGALARGMVLGQDGALTDDVREDFRTTGLAHLVAASGANVILLATLVLALGAAAGLGLSARLWLAIALVAAYVPLAGAGPSIQRAAVMGAAGLVAALAGRPASRWYALLLAAALTLAWNPHAAADPGWQLSFAAVLSLLALVPALRTRLGAAGVPRGLAEALAVTIAATLGTAPLIALYFERLSLVSLPANVLAAPAVAPVMWLGTIAGALGQVEPGARRAGRGARGAAARLPHLAGRAARRRCRSPRSRCRRRARSACSRSTAPRGRGAARPGAGCARAGRRRARAALAVAAVAGGAALVLLARPPGAAARPDDLLSRHRPGRRDAHPARRHRRPRRHRPARRPRARRACATPAYGAWTCSCSRTTRPTTTAPPPRCSTQLPVGLVLDGEEATRAGVGDAASRPRTASGGSPPTPARSCARARSSCACCGRAASPRRPPAPSRTTARRCCTCATAASTCCSPPTRSPTSSAACSCPQVEALKVSHHGSDDPGLPGVLRSACARAPRSSRSARHNSYGHPTPVDARRAARRARPDRAPHRPRRHREDHRARAAGCRSRTPRLRIARHRPPRRLHSPRCPTSSPPTSSTATTTAASASAAPRCARSPSASRDPTASSASRATTPRPTSWPARSPR